MTESFTSAFRQLHKSLEKGCTRARFRTHQMKRNSNRGFTLVEILIVIALLGVVSIPLGAAMMMGLMTFQTESKAVQIEQDQRIALSWITELCRTYPTEVTYLETPVTLTVHGHSFKLNGETLEETTSGGTRQLVSDVNVFDVTSVVKDTSGKLQSFNISIKTHYNKSELNVSTTVQLQRYTTR